MNNNDIEYLMNMLNNINKEQLNNGLNKINQILSPEEKQKIIQALNYRRKWWIYIMRRCGGIFIWKIIFQIC